MSENETRLERFFVCKELGDSAMGPAKIRTVARPVPGTFVQCVSRDRCSRQGCSGRAELKLVDKPLRAPRDASILGEGSMILSKES